MRGNELSLKAGGTIAPSVFVKFDTAADEQVVQATGVTDHPIGVSQEGQKRIPGVVGSDTAIAAESGDQLRIFAFGDDCLITCGGTVTRGDFVTSDANGKAVTATTGNFYGGMALQSGVSGGKIRIFVMFGTL